MKEYFIMPLPIFSARFRRTTSEEEQDAIAAAAEPLACSKLFFSRADLDVDWMPTNGAVLKVSRVITSLWH